MKMTKTNFKESKIGLKMEAERLRRKEIVENYQQFQQAKEEKLLAKSNMKKAANAYVKTICETTDPKEAVKAKTAFDVAQKEYSEAAKNVEVIYAHLKELEALNQKSKIDKNVALKCVTFAGITFITELVELPGNLVNLRAIKIAKPITDLLKL